MREVVRVSGTATGRCLQNSCDKMPLYGEGEGALSGRLGKLVASLAEVTRSIPGCAETAPIYTTHETLNGYCP